MKKLLLIFTVLLVGATTLSAQEDEEKRPLSSEEREALIDKTLKERDVELVIDPWGGKGVECKVWQKSGKIWSDDTKTSERFFERGYTFKPVDFVMGYIYIFEDNEKFYGVKMSEVQFKDSDDAEELDFMIRGNSKYMSSMAGRFYGTSAALYMMLLVMGIAAVIAFLYFTCGMTKIRPIFLVVVPLAILIFSFIEIFGYMKFGGDMFWWCEYERYGFFGSLLRVFPFGAMVFAQVASIRVYERALFKGNDDSSDDDRKISLKPAAWSLALCIPIPILLAIAMAGLDMQDTVWMDLVTLLGFLVTLGLGLFISFRRNIKAFGRLTGLYVTVFSIVYIIGCIISAIAMVTLIIQIIWQILVVIGTILILAMVGSRRRIYRNGRVYEEV